jgi:methionyl-tRNA synthetase
MKDVCTEAGGAYLKAMDAFDLHIGIGEVFKVVRAANRYIEERAPWALMKQEGGKPKAAGVLFTVSEVLRNTAVLLFPFMPVKAQGIWETLGIKTDISSDHIDESLTWRDDWEGLSAGIGTLTPLFPRIEPGEHETTSKEKDEMLVEFEEFKRLDLRVAHVKSATMVEGAKNLIKMNIDIGDEERQIVAGIAGHYAPESLVGKNIVVIANLKPAKIRGVESQGMLLAATDGDSVILVVPDKDASAGARIS